MTFLPISSLPAVDASLNAAAGILLIAGHRFIRAGKIALHRACMIAAFCCSVVFLVFYLYFHAHAGVVRFGGHGWIRPAYFTLLVSHTVLAAAVPPLAIITLALALRGKFASHRRIARWTYPIWLYVSITGVAVYWLLYVAYSPIWPA
ncbi:MAG TPA: DUF420 domain-containing protein [Candidatus Acidoferrales bacterium]|nr:DUF420 domain-containing protein [Candidatus Acidoferrales bacterium]